MPTQDPNDGNAAKSIPAGPPHKFLISSNTCNVAELRQMCDPLGLDSSGTFILVKARVLNAIRDRQISEADLWAMPAMKPAFTRKPSSRKGFARTKTGSAAARASTVNLDVMDTDTGD